LKKRYKRFTRNLYVSMVSFGSTLARHDKI
jgi:hypothetical protein